MTGIVFLEDRRRANVLEKVIRRTCHTSHNTLAEHSWVACERSRRFRSRQSSINIDSTSIEILVRSMPRVVGRYENSGREFRHRGRSPVLPNVNSESSSLEARGSKIFFADDLCKHCTGFHHCGLRLHALGWVLSFLGFLGADREACALDGD